MAREKSGWIGYHIHQIVAAVDAAAVAVVDAEGDAVVAVDAAAGDDDEQDLQAPWDASHDCNALAP